MTKLDLKINGRTEVIYDKVLYKSLIQDINKDELIISIPVADGIYLTIKNGEKIDQYYYDDKGNIYKYTTTVLGRIVENGMPFYKLSLPFNIEKIQRRDYVRVNMINEITYMTEDSDDIKKGLILDLSGGGARIKIKEKLSKNDIILVNLNLEGSSLSLKGQIVRVDLTETKEYICGVRFTNISESMKEKIIRLVFTVMRKQRELL